MKQAEVVIVGAGHGGAQTAVALRQQGFPGSIMLIGEESDYPYERPPLSKEYLAGDRPFERLLIRPTEFWAERQIELRTNERVEAVDPVARRVRTVGGDEISYGRLVWAAGGTARRLAIEGDHLGGIHTVRSRADIDLLAAELPAVERVVVIGGGYIGLEATASLTKLGKQVTVLEALDRVLARVAGEPLSRFFEAEHRAHGVDIRLNASVAGIEGQRLVSGVRLATGEILPCQMVIVGVGIVPAVAPLIAARAVGGNGVDVDAQCRTSLPDVFAIGDCARHPNRFADGQHIRLESVQNANDQAGVVAKTIMGEATTYDAVPWFWSTQYDLKLQTIGLSSGYDEAIVRGDPASRSFSVVYLKANRVIALDCVNAMRDYVQGKRLVVEAMPVDAIRLADPAIPLKAL